MRPDEPVAAAEGAQYAHDMGSPRREELLEQLRALPVEDRDYIEAVLMREAYEQGRRTPSTAEIAEIESRARDALQGSAPSYSREESIARARAALAARTPREP